MATDSADAREDEEAVFAGFGRETLLDLTVNMVPMAILLFFVALFLVWNVWTGAGWMMWIGHGLMLFTLFALVVVTWVSGKLVQRDERRGRNQDVENSE